MGPFYDGTQFTMNTMSYIFSGIGKYGFFFLIHNHENFFKARVFFSNCFGTPSVSHYHNMNVLFRVRIWYEWRQKKTWGEYFIIKYHRRVLHLTWHRTTARCSTYTSYRLYFVSFLTCIVADDLTTIIKSLLFFTFISFQ